jgi:menaquinone-specific isochorismate synthase
MKIRTRILGEHPALHSISIEGMEISASWIRGGDGFIAFGIHQSTTITGKERFKLAREWWNENINQFTIENDLGGFGTGPLMFTSFSFDRDEPSLFIIPHVIVGQKNGKSWITWIGDSEQPPLQINNAKLHAGTNITWKDGTLTPSEWQHRVSSAIEKIKSGDVEKVVLARDAVATSDSPIDLHSIIDHLVADYPSTWVYTLGGLVGATPELLLRLSKSLATSRVLAGTIRKTGDEEKDLANAASLAKSSKDLEEHEYAVRSVVEALSPFTTSTNVPDSPFVLHLANVMHLATDVTGVIHEGSNKTDIFALLNSLHPTAAVCGTPRNKAFEIISELEGMNRQRYSGPVGWVDYRGDGEMGIALRCGQLSQDKLSLRAFAGCGIVVGSDPEKELAEAHAKLAPMRSALA